MIKVPYMKMPRCCNECPFGRLKYSRPLTDGRHGYICQVEYYEKGKYETVREAPYDEHVVPVKCPLIDDAEGREQLMNKARRDQISKAIDLLSEARGILETCMDEEQEYMDNMPENLQGSEKYELAEEAVSNLSDAMDTIDEAVDYAESAME